MAQSMQELLPVADYKIANVGPTRDWSFKGDKGADVNMATDSIQLEGHTEYWIDLNRAQDKPKPTVGETLKGHVEQDVDGKYNPKFVKPKSAGGGYRGGGQAGPGAVWSSAMETASHIVAGYYAAIDEKPKGLKEYFAKVEMLAPKVNAAVDKLVAANKPAPAPKADTTTSEAGESPAPAAAEQPNEIIDISDEEIGW